jgi:hypothetical protein
MWEHLDMMFSMWFLYQILNIQRKECRRLVLPWTSCLSLLFNDILSCQEYIASIIRLLMNMEQLVKWQLSGETEVLSPLPFCSLQIPNVVIWDRTRAAAVGSLRLTTWAMARPCHKFLRNVWLWLVIWVRSAVHSCVFLQLKMDASCFALILHLWKECINFTSSNKLRLTKSCVSIIKFTIIYSPTANGIKIADAFYWFVFCSCCWSDVTRIEVFPRNAVTRLRSETFNIFVKSAQFEKKLYTD